MFEILGDVESAFLKLSYSQPAPMAGAYAINNINKWLLEGPPFPLPFQTTRYLARVSRRRTRPTDSPSHRPAGLTQACVSRAAPSLSGSFSCSSS